MKLSMQQVEDSYEADVSEFWDPVEEQFVGEFPPLDREVDDTVYRTTTTRKELRTKYLRERGEVVGQGSEKHRKW